MSIRTLGASATIICMSLSLTGYACAAWGDTITPIKVGGTIPAGKYKLVCGKQPKMCGSGVTLRPHKPITPPRPQ